MGYRMHTHRGRAASGFTLIELIAAMAVAGILMAIAVPPISSFIIDARMTAQANDLVADLLYARSEAATRGTHVVICPSADGTSCSTSESDWRKGRIIFSDANSNGAVDSGESIRTTAALSGGSSLAPAGFNSLVAIMYGPFGVMLPPANSGSFKVCPPSASSGRQISIGANGRPSVARTSCP